MSRSKVRALAVFFLRQIPNIERYEKLRRRLKRTRAGHRGGFDTFDSRSSFQSLSRSLSLSRHTHTCVSKRPRLSKTQYSESSIYRCAQYSFSVSPLRFFAQYLERSRVPTTKRSRSFFQKTLSIAFKPRHHMRLNHTLQLYTFEFSPNRYCLLDAGALPRAAPGGPAPPRRHTVSICALFSNSSHSGLRFQKSAICSSSTDSLSVYGFKGSRENTLHTYPPLERGYSIHQSTPLTRSRRVEYCDHRCCVGSDAVWSTRVLDVCQIFKGTRDEGCAVSRCATLCGTVTCVSSRRTLRHHLTRRT